MHIESQHHPQHCFHLNVYPFARARHEKLAKRLLRDCKVLQMNVVRQNNKEMCIN
jgi:hypothetical protein